MARKSKTILFVTITMLVVIVTVFAALNAGMLSEKRAAQQSQTFYISLGGDKTAVTMNDITALEPEDHAANYKTNGKAPVEKQYKGVSLKSVLEKFSIDASNAESFSFTAADGYASAISAAEALDEENCLIVVAVDGQPLGSKEDGGAGPFMMILAKDQFSQRWCKFLMEVEIS